MIWKTHVQHFDKDTIRILEIAVHFLTQYFGHESSEAERLMDTFLTSSRYDEDFFHYQSSYRVAAIVHYLGALGGDPSSMGNWLVDEGHHQTPNEAHEYFREHYFDQPLRYVWQQPRSEDG